MLCGSLDGTGVWGRMDTCICMAESPETITTLLIVYTPIQNKFFFLNVADAWLSNLFSRCGLRIISTSYLYSPLKFSKCFHIDNPTSLVAIM